MSADKPDVKLVEIDPNDMAPVAFIKFSTDDCTLIEKDEETLERHA